jgi:hypothetical protein
MVDSAMQIEYQAVNSEYRAQAELRDLNKTTTLWVKDQETLDILLGMCLLDGVELNLQIPLNTVKLTGWWVRPI